MSSLTDLKKGEKAIIDGFSTENIPTKFLEMGLVPGARVEYRCSAPFNGPICVSLCHNKCLLALRKTEAVHIRVNRAK